MQSVYDLLTGYAHGVYINDTHISDMRNDKALSFLLDIVDECRELESWENAQQQSYSDLRELLLRILGGTASGKDKRAFTGNLLRSKFYFSNTVTYLEFVFSEEPSEEDLERIVTLPDDVILAELLKRLDTD